METSNPVLVDSVEPAPQGTIFVYTFDLVLKDKPPYSVRETMKDVSDLLTAMDPEADYRISTPSMRIAIKTSRLLTDSEMEIVSSGLQASLKRHIVPVHSLQLVHAEEYRPEAVEEVSEPTDDQD